jgi:hypothetical protein
MALLLAGAGLAPHNAGAKFVGSLQLIRKVRPFCVVVGENGLRWRESRREKVFPWSDVR